jgi:hypothetical protein
VATSPNNDVKQSPGLAGHGGTVTPVGVHTEAALKENPPGKRKLRKGPTGKTGQQEVAAKLRELTERKRNVTIQNRAKVYIRFAVSMSCYEALVELTEARGVKWTMVLQECMETGIRKWKNLPQRGAKLNMAFGDRIDALSQETYGDKPDPVATSYADFVRQEVKAKPEEYAGWLPASPPVQTSFVPPVDDAE